MNFDIDPWPEPQRLPFVGTSDWDVTRLELIALASELATLSRLSREELQRVSDHDRAAQLAIRCGRLHSAAQEVLAADAVWSNWSQMDLGHAIDDFYAHLADAGAVRTEIARMVARRPKRFR